MSHRPLLGELQPGCPVKKPPPRDWSREALAPVTRRFAGP